MFILAASLLFITACSSPANSTDEENHTDSRTTAEELNKNEKQDLPDKTLQKGDQDKSVQHLQAALKEINYPIEANGKFDAETTWAITDIQLQLDDLDITGIYDMDTKEAINKAVKDKQEINPGSGLKQPEKDSGAKDKTVANPYEILSVVNKQSALPADYTPVDLVVPDIPFPFTEDLPKKQMRKVAAKALEEMFEASEEAGLDLVAQSGYRSFERQEAIFASNSQEHGKEAANNFSARAGESEHQTGLTMDVTTPSIENQLIIEFGETEEGKWLQQHAADYGYIIRYPKGKEDITNYQYEPWHIRYVGKKAAKEIMINELTLEEYIEKITN